MSTRTTSFRTRLSGGAAVVLLVSFLLVKRVLGTTVQAVGILAMVMLLLAFTRIPFDAHRSLGTTAGECAGAVDHIVVLGGSGMPSGPELLRLHRAAQVAMEFPRAKVLVVHPQDATVIGAMVQELVLRGVPLTRIEVLPAGENTREQALLCAKRWMGEEHSIALVTAPENMYRSVLAFRRAGLARVCGMPAWDHAMRHDFRYRHAALGGKAYMPDVSAAAGVRYTFWNYLKLEVTCLREYVAIAYYRLNGWL